MSTSFSDGFPHAHPNTSQIDFYRRHVAVECDAASELSPPSAAASESPRRAPPSAADGPSAISSLRPPFEMGIYFPLDTAGVGGSRVARFPLMPFLCAGSKLRIQTNPPPPINPHLCQKASLSRPLFPSYFSRFEAEPHLSAAARCSGEKERKQGGARMKGAPRRPILTNNPTT
jgi:hypothetical protein